MFFNGIPEDVTKDMSRKPGGDNRVRGKNEIRVIAPTEVIATNAMREDLLNVLVLHPSIERKIDAWKDCTPSVFRRQYRII